MYAEGDGVLCTENDALDIDHHALFPLLGSDFVGGLVHATDFDVVDQDVDGTELLSDLAHHSLVLRPRRSRPGDRKPPYQVTAQPRNRPERLQRPSIPLIRQGWRSARDPHSVRASCSRFSS